MALPVRKNQADLSGDERARYVAALKKMKSDGTYDWYVSIHLQSMQMVGGVMIMWAHKRPAFLPWHRQLCLSFENDMRAADAALHGGTPSTLGLPYWDWINYRSKKKFLWWGRLWGNDFMGPDGDSSDHNKVTSGPFQASQWPLTVKSDPSDASFLQRALSQATGVSELPQQEHWDAARAITTYDTSPWDGNVGVAPAPTPAPVRFSGVDSFRNVFEGWVDYQDTATSIPIPVMLHNRVHVWVGGSMLPFSSPNDPVFFLHHCNVDRLWAQWWSDDPRRPYLPADGVPNAVDPVGESMGGMNTGPNENINLVGHHFHDPMPPWDGRTDPLKGVMPVVTPADVLNHTAIMQGGVPAGYRYDTDPPALAAKGGP
jgi:tyrosinase